MSTIQRPNGQPGSPRRVVPYGAWPSPVTPDLASAGSISFSEPQVDGATLYWLEGRAAERGRTVLVRRTADGTIADVVPPGVDVGTRVHEYGGGGYVVDGGRIVYADRGDGSVWMIDGAPRALVRVPGCRYAGFTIDAARNRVYAVREDHRDRPPTSPENTIVALTLDPGIAPEDNAGTIVTRGADFYLAPQRNAAGTYLAWIEWEHPAMPWEATTLCEAEIHADGTFGAPRMVAGGAGTESIVEAHWSADGTLMFAGDRTGWWNLYAWKRGRTVPLAPAEAEIGEPPWVFGRSMFAPLARDRALCAFVRDGSFYAGIVANGELRTLPFGNVAISPLPAAGGALFIATPATAPAAVCFARSLDDANPTILRSAMTVPPDPAGISVGMAVTVPTDDGETTHAAYYAPCNAQVEGPPGDLPPLVVMSHGGPTSMHAPVFSLAIQWWTSRGFAVAHVNYRGSSGFGRAYRQRLEGEWGVLDVLDCISVARYAIAQRWCDPRKIAIRGGSASGMTTLLAVAQSDVFSAAGSLYGVMELEALAAGTHKFEARYTDGMVGPLPQARERYRERSPLTHAGSVNVPVILFAGLDDHVVPPSQAEGMRAALEARGVRVEYHAFAGEGHGFRQAATLRTVLETELAFYRDVFGIAS
jgi:dienelactone hydrolase